MIEPPSPGPNPGITTGRALLAALTASWVLASAACTSDDSRTAMPSSVLSASQIEQRLTEATDFSDSYHASWPDIGAALDRMVEDVVFYDPADGDFTIEGKASVVPAVRGFANFFSDTEWPVERTFLSADGAAYRVPVAEGLWPYWLTEPPDHAPVVELDEFRFDNGDVTHLTIWFDTDTLEMLEFGCFAIDGCPELQRHVDWYLDAWSSGDVEQIAALYAENATFTDSLLGIDATGPDEISLLSEARFGSGERNFEVVDVYAQTSGPEPATEDEEYNGPVIAVGIHYRVSVDGRTGYESLTTFELGTRQVRGFDLHPQGLITREEVFYDPDTLVASGIAD